MDEYKIEFYKNDEKIEVTELPVEYLNGIIQICKSEITSRERTERIFRRMVN